MDTESIKKTINDEFDKIEEKINALDNTLSGRTNPQNREIVYAYISGFFDGEGYIGVDKQNLLLSIAIANANLDVLKRIKSVFMGEICVHTEKSESCKKIWIWRINNRNWLKFFLETILPYSIVKRSQILDGLEFLERIITTKYCRGGMSLEERKYREYMYHKFKEPKHHIYSENEIRQIDKQIKTTTKTERKFNDIVYAYMSGVFDAEGCVDTHFNKRSGNIHLRIRLANTYPFILIGMKQVFGGNVNLPPKSQNIKHRQNWVWQTIAKDDVKFLLTKISKYSIVKKSQINLGFKFLETDNYQTKLLIAEKLKELKDAEYTDEEICSLNEQIANMNIDKLQYKIEDYT